MSNPKDFTYYFMDDMLIDTIRVIYRKEYTVLTVYYPYHSLKFHNLLKKYNYRNSLIYERYKEHSTDLHKNKENPYEWHFHLMLPEKDIPNFLKDLFKENKLSTRELDKILEYLDNPTKKLKNIEYKGSENIKALQKFQKKLKYKLFVYNTLKKEVVSEDIIMLSLYLTRFDIFEFKLTDNLLQKLKKSKINKKGRDSIKRYIKEYKLDNYSVIYKEKKIELDLNKAYIEFLVTVLHSYQSYYSKKRRISLKKYLELRMNLELSWSLFQSSKIMKQLGYTSYEDFLKSKPKVEKLETYLVKAYFIFYTRFQTCINLESSVDKECLLQVNLSDARFKRAIETCYQKIILTDSDKLKFTSTSVISPFI